MIGGCPGSIFEGEIPETFCFVPQDLITAEGEDVRVAEGAYVRSGWDVRNMRVNTATEGEHLFPNAHRPVNDLTGRGVRVFLDRVRRIWH